MSEKCDWHEDGDGVWNTDCGNHFELLTGTPAMNKMIYCPYCGKLIEEQPLREDEER